VSGRIPDLPLIRTDWLENAGSSSQSPGIALNAACFCTRQQVQGHDAVALAGLIVCLSPPDPRRLRKTLTDEWLGLSCSHSGYIAEYGPAHGDQTKRIRLRHLDDAVQTDIDVPAREGLHRANPRWRLDADIHRPWRFPFYGLSSRLFPLFVLSSVKLEEALAGERLLKPVEKLGGRIDLVVMLAIGKHRHLVQVFGKPRCILRDRDKAVFDHCGLRVQPHDLLALRLVAGDTVAALADQFLDQLGARGLVLNQHDIGTEQVLLFAHRALECGIFEPLAQQTQ